MGRRVERVDLQAGPSVVIADGGVNRRNFLLPVITGNTLLQQVEIIGRWLKRIYTKARGDDVGKKR